MEPLPPEIAQKLPEVRRLCERFGVKRLAVFGSAVKGTFDPRTSDLDFAVEFEPRRDPLDLGRAYLDFWDELKDLFGRPVDLVVASRIRNPYFAEIVRLTQQPLYDAA